VLAGLILSQQRWPPSKGPLFLDDTSAFPQWTLCHEPPLLLQLLAARDSTANLLWWW
jgi:hypothetical protein